MPFKQPPAGRRKIRALFDDETITVYQAFNDEIVDAILEKGRFAAPFSFDRMTWIKPSFLWMMERSRYGTAPDQERTLAIRISLEGWLEALSNASLSTDAGSTEPVRVQWDPERDLKGNKLPIRSIQVGLGPAIVRRYARDWIIDITDISEQVEELRELRQQGKFTRAQAMLPAERQWNPPPEIAKRIGMLS
jgi:hypothetical protein